MKPTEILSNEHKVILQVLDCLDAIVHEAGKSGALDAGDAGDALDFILNFADHCHHKKEEDRLFPAMEARGIPRMGGPVAVMLMEHDQGRGHVKEMSSSLEAAVKGDAEALRRFSGNASSFINLLRSHIDKEDNILYSIANNVLTLEDQQNLLDSFQRVEKEDIGDGVHEKYIDMANRLADKHGVKKAAAAQGHHCCGGH